MKAVATEKTREKKKRKKKKPKQGKGKKKEKKKKIYQGIGTKFQRISPVAFGNWMEFYYYNF